MVTYNPSSPKSFNFTTINTNTLSESTLIRILLQIKRVLCVFSCGKQNFYWEKLLTALHPLFFNGKMWVIRALELKTSHILSF